MNLIIDKKTIPLHKKLARANAMNSLVSYHQAGVVANLPGYSSALHDRLGAISNHTRKIFGVLASSPVVGNEDGEPGEGYYLYLNVPKGDWAKERAKAHRFYKKLINMITDVFPYDVVDDKTIQFSDLGVQLQKVSQKEITLQFRDKRLNGTLNLDLRQAKALTQALFALCYRE